MGGGVSFDVGMEINWGMRDVQIVTSAERSLGAFSLCL